MSLLESQTMPRGTTLPSFNLKDAKGQEFYSKSLLESPLSLIVFTCNHCPYAIASWPVMVELYNKYRKSGLQVVAINPNNNPDYPEDRFDTMRPFASEHGIDFPYLFDGDQKVAELFNAVCTPDPFLFKSGKLYYHGRFNDNWQTPESAKEHSMILFIQAALEDGNIPTAQFPSMGCSIKWVR